MNSPCTSASEPLGISVRVRDEQVGDCGQRRTLIGAQQVRKRVAGGVGEAEGDGGHEATA